MKVALKENWANVRKKSRKRDRRKGETKTKKTMWVCLSLTVYMCT